MKTVVMNYREPKVLNKKVENGKLRLTLDWYQLGKGESIISKTPYGYNYEDVGYMKRSFTEIDTMMWEFELPQFLKIDIENLPLLNEDKNKPELTNTGEIELSKQ